MSLIDDTYFVKEIALPEGKYSTIQSEIARHEDEIIFNLFGYELGTLVLAYNVTTSPQRIKDIVEGKEYSVSASGVYKPGGGDTTIKWNGLVNTEKKSLLAYWVYYWWCREHESSVTGAGGAKPKLENATLAGLGAEAAYSWHEMLKLYGQINQPVIIPSCFNFMNEFQTTYPEWAFTPKGSANRWGL